MPDETLISEKMRVKAHEGAAALLEPGETVQLWVSNLTVPVFLYILTAGLFLLPYLLTHLTSVLVTDRNVYVVKNRVSSFKAQSVLLKAPLGSVDAEVAGSAFPGRYLRVGEHKLWLQANSRVHRRARAVAAAARGEAGSTAQLTDRIGG